MYVYINKALKKTIFFTFIYCINNNLLSGVYIFLFDPPPQKYGQITSRGKKLLKGNETRGGEMHIFSPIGKKNAYFFPNWLKIYKIAQKMLKFFRLRRAPLILFNFIWGKNINQEGGRGLKKSLASSYIRPNETLCFQINYKTINTWLTLLRRRCSPRPPRRQRRAS